jgi:hypothetical protein
MMDIAKALELAPTYLSEYFGIAVATVTRPGIRFETQSTDDLVGQGPRLSGKLFVFMIINALLGTTVNALIPLRKAGPDFTSTVVVLMLSWFFYSTLTHWICRLLRGVASYEITMAVSLQLMSVLYLLASFLALIIGAVIRVPVISSALTSAGPIAEVVAKYPVSIFFLLHFLGLAIYLPLALRRVHEFGRWRVVFLGALATFGTGAAIALYLVTGLLLYHG